MKEKGFFISRLQSIIIAMEGIKSVFVTQQNARIHAVFTLAVFLFAWVLKLPLSDWISLLLTVGLVWTAEIFNTAIEFVVDLVSPEQHPKAKLIKDISAGAVLLSVLISIMVGILIFGPPLWVWING